MLLYFKTFKLLSNLAGYFGRCRLQKFIFLVKVLQTCMHRQYSNSTTTERQQQTRLLACMCDDNLTAAKH